MATVFKVPHYLQELHGPYDIHVKSYLEIILTIMDLNMNIMIFSKDVNLEVNEYTQSLKAIISIVTNIIALT